MSEGTTEISEVGALEEMEEQKMRRDTELTQ